jgi:PEP-CTERM motif
MSRFGKLMLRSGLSVAAMCMAGSATAAEYLITYTGIVRNSVDWTGVFGGSSNSLNGLSYTSVYTLTDPNPGGTIINGGILGQSIGGSINGRPVPVTATLTINGITQASNGSYNSYAAQIFDPIGNYFATDHLAFEANVTPQFITQRYIGDQTSSRQSFLSTTDYTSSLNYSFLPGENIAVGTFLFAQEDRRGGGIYPVYASGQLYANSVTIALFSAGAGAVPEPASWMLMIAGFGLVGGAMRRGKGRQRQPSRTVCNKSVTSFQS